MRKNVPPIVMMQNKIAFRAYIERNIDNNSFENQ